MRKITVTANGQFSIQDVAPTESSVLGTAGGVATFVAGDVKSFVVTESEWNHAVRRQLNALAARRVPVLSSGVLTGKSKPLMTWTQERVPGGRPRLHQLEGTVSVGGAAQTIVLRGENLIPGLAATSIIGKSTGKLTLTAARKGWQGNLVSVVIAPDKGAGSVTTVLGDDGTVTVTVVPAAGASTANAIATQLGANALATRFVLASGGGTGAVLPQTVTLAGGDGAGVAWNWIKSNAAGHFLLLEAIKPGNTGNGSAVSIAAASGGGSVTLTNGVYVVVPAAATNTLTAIAAQINGDAALKLLVKATVIGTGSNTVPVTAATYLAAGSGETPSAAIGGAAADVTVMTDTAMTLAFTGASVTSGGVAANEVAAVTVLTDFGLLSIDVVAAA